MRIIIAELIWDMVRAKIMPILTFFLAFSILSCASFALKTVDAQADTHCTATECWTSVDLGKHLSTTDISTAKSLDLKSKLPTIKGIENMDIKKIGNTLNITGKIALGSSQYWTLDIPEVDLSIDPYWNSSSNGSTTTFTTPFTSPSHPSVDFDIYIRGERIKIGANPYHIDTIKSYSTVQATNLIIATNSSIIGAYALSGDTATVGVTLNANTEYHLWFNNTGNWAMDVNGAFNYPYNADGYQILSDVQCSSGSSGLPSCITSYNYNLWINLYSITGHTETTTSTYYEFGLKLNGTEGNITASNNTLFNVFAYSNLTNLRINLTRNDSLIDSQIGNITASQNLTEGLYKYIAVSNNSDSVTYWANVINTFGENVTNETNETNVTTPNITIGGNTSIVFDIASLEPNQRYCFNASMRADVYSEANITRYIVCDYGCESNACNPNPIYVYLGIGAIFIIVLWIATRRKRK